MFSKYWCVRSLFCLGLATAGVLLSVTLPVDYLSAAVPPNTKVAPASHDAELALSRIKVQPGLKIDLWAAEPLLANPVAFCIDERGRVYVAETFRQSKGVEDNRGHGHWLDDDLAAQTLEDRLAYFWKHLGNKVWQYTNEEDRIRILADTNGDGKADSSTIFSDGYNAVLEGTGAGVLARGGDVWYTNIPHLWRLRDTDGDGKDDLRKPLHYGYGVRVALRGHDMHGLTFGPDGRIYFSIGDRGFNVTSQEGKRFVYPDQGAVLRCNPDGSELEVFASGLRNPQEIAFDDFGNLFTGDNNSDSGDRARWVYVVDGGETGWRMSFQYLSDRGPWNREKLWHPQHPGQAAYIVPPIANIADGPSGLTHYPGVGLPEKYADHFFLVDFRGGYANSGVRSFAMKPQGASFELVDSQEFLWSILATDVDFGPDGAMYVADWVESWDGVGKGRIYKLHDPASEDNPALKQAVSLFKTGFDKRSNTELAGLLGHASAKVRQEAQFHLADRGPAAVETLTAVATRNSNRFARLHAIWGLGQIGRKTPAVLAGILPLLGDADLEIRGNTARVIGEAAYNPGAEKLVPLLQDAEPRVRFLAALAYSRAGTAGQLAPIIELLRDNADADPYVRHAGVMALTRLGQLPQLQAYASDASPAVRRGVLLALRRQQHPEIATFLADTDPSLVEEAARAINDVPINAALPQLAGLANRHGLTPATQYRVINANFRLGTADAARVVAAYAADADTTPEIRKEAVQALGDWAAPSGRDRVMGLWRPLPKRDRELAAAAFRDKLGGIFAGPGPVREAATKVAVQLEIKEVGPVLVQTLHDSRQPPQSRADALEALAGLNYDKLAEAVETARTSDQPELRVAARRALVRLQPDAALADLKQALEAGTLIEKQSALSLLAEIKGSGSADLLVAWLDKAVRGEVPLEIQLDLLEAAAQRKLPQIQQKLTEFQALQSTADPLAAYRPAQAGGQAERGRRVFQRGDLSCVRCHKVQGQGGEVGPDLSKIGSQQKRDYLLEAIVFPDKQIAKGFDPVVIVTDSGKVYSGIIREETDTHVRLMNADGQLVAIPKTEIEERVRGKSAMPEDLIKKLNRFELRDLVEFLSSLK
ncbi:MAG: HEAT repeat domain-containing protein [Planctomycetes bacterium]|nr:HEAT repeat domain-containing protein [Planctomycetota bacterium]